VKHYWLFGVAAAMFCIAGDAAAQTKPVARTTRGGVFSVEQASRGADVYAGYCKSCHTAETHTGANFRTHWRGKLLSDLFVYIRDRMPKNDPGSLSAEEYADVLAYVLKMNRMPAGKSDLQPDSTQLSRIRIETTVVPTRKDP
jgi:S-disulfanyl-L-cysteine oxidoreductase SoxD